MNAGYAFLTSRVLNNHAYFKFSSHCALLASIGGKRFVFYSRDGHGYFT